MAYDDWPEEFQQVWDDLEVTDAFEGMSASRLEYAEFMFEEAFMTYEDEKMAPDDISFARSEFWSTVGYDYEEFFDWEGWREAMGYDLCAVLAVSQVRASALKPSHGTEKRLDSVRRLSVLLGAVQSTPSTWKRGGFMRVRTGSTLTRLGGSGMVPTLKRFTSGHSYSGMAKVTRFG